MNEKPVGPLASPYGRFWYKPGKWYHARNHVNRKGRETPQSYETLTATAIAGPRHEHLCGLWGK